MAGNAYNLLIATPVHYYLISGDACHAAMITGSEGADDTVNLRQMDGLSAGLPVLADHANVVHDESGTYANNTWHYANGCANTS